MNLSISLSSTGKPISISSKEPSTKHWNKWIEGLSSSWLGKEDPSIWHPFDRVKRHSDRAFLFEGLPFMNMGRSTFEEGFKIIKFHHKNYDSVVSTLRALRAFKITTLDNFLCGYAQDRIHTNQYQILEQFKTNIHEVLTEVIENYLRRIESCKKFCGRHFNDVAFHL